MPVASVRDLHKSYGAVHAVRGIDLDVEPGEVLCVLGPNGAGKTTTIEILEGFLAPDEGSVEVLGRDPAAAGSRFRDRIGIVLQAGGLEPELTVTEILTRLTALYSQPRAVPELLDLVGLAGSAGTRVKHLSGGQHRRLDLAAALAGDPELLFLDEPTTGFDPAARRRAWETISGLRDEGRAVLLTTHYLEEAQALADRILVMVRGRIVADGDPATLGGRAVGPAAIKFQVEDPAAVPDLGPGMSISASTVQIITDDPVAVLHRVTSWALAEEQTLVGLEVHRPSLEDIYLSLVGDG